MPFSKRTDWDQQSNALTRSLEELRSRGTPIADLTESNPTRCGFEYPAAVLNALSDPKNLQYAPDSKGMASTREAVGRFYNFNPGRILLTSSTSESYSFLFRLLLDPGDKVLIPCPSYPLFQFLLELNDAAFDHYPLVYDGQWRIDFEALERLIDSRTKVIILVNPNNPTGSYVKKDELKRLNAICSKYGITIISDEVFFDYRLGDGPFVSLRDNAQALTFVLGGLSKTMGLPQMKLGWILASGPRNPVQGALERLEIIADTYLSVNTPVQNALPAWLACKDLIQHQILDRVRVNLGYLTGAGVKILAIEGGWNAVLNVEGIDEEDFVLDALRRHHVLIHPGFFFDFEDPGHLVLSLLPGREQFAKIDHILKDSHG